MSNKNVPVRASRIVMATVGLMAAFSTTACGVIDYSEGERVGVVTKFSKKGIFCKTWEGELAMANFSPRSTGNGSTMSNSFEFSVKNEAIVGQVQEALRSQAPVELEYNQVLMPWFCSQGTEYEIVGVKPANVNNSTTTFTPGQPSPGG